MVRHPPRPLLAAILIAASTLLAGCGHGGSRTARGCEVDPDCGGAGRCVAGLCQASAPPVADFTVPPGLVTQREIDLASTSRDPDPGDGVVAWSWTVTRAGAACDSEVSGADEASPRVVFWCPGTYRIGLTVTDSSGVESAPLDRTVEVVPTTSAPTLSVTGDDLVHHRCAGDPVRCTLAWPLELAASGTAAGGGALTFRWSVRPPEGAGPGASVDFTPSDTAASPALQVGVAGTAITGAWSVQVRARDPEGNLAVATRAFEVGNRSPVVRAAAAPGSGALALDHTVGDCPSGAGRCYLASGADAFTAEDPDGDPLGPVVLAADAAKAGAGSLAQVGVGGQPSAFRFATPLGNPAGFRAADGSSGFRLGGTVADVHGATSSLTLAVVIGNRAPVPAWAPGTVTPPHAFSPAAKAYQASAEVAGFTDPDGDPLQEAGSGGDAVCRAFSASGGTVSASCALAYVPVEGQVPPLATFVAPHAVTARMSDGWATASIQTAVAIQNRAPVVPAYRGPADACTCVCVAWLDGEPGSPPECTRYAWNSGGLVDSFPAAASDPDGDPLAVAITYGYFSAAVAANDGAASTAGTWTATSARCSTQDQVCLP